MQTYVVRIYRHGEDDRPALVSGTVEAIPGGRRRAFDNLQELSAILAQPARRRVRRAGGTAGRSATATINEE